MLKKFQPNLLIPAGVAIVLIVTMTLLEARVSDRFTTSSMQAADFVERFENVPREFGNWRGVDQDVDEQVKQTAGAVGHVSRQYTNTETGDRVDLWLIVGHARDIVRHTPNICYASSGFRQVVSTTRFPFDVPGMDAEFRTAQFSKEDVHGRSRVRVFWGWNGNEPGKQKWEGPDGARMYYGNNRALYKMYFTAPVMDDEEQASDSIAYQFGREILPLINQALFPEEASGAAPEIEEPPVSAQPSEDAAAEATTDAE